MLCETKPGSCMRKGAVYRITCKICQRNGKSVVYVGETARSGWDRMVEHSRAIRNDNIESPMIEHAQEDHPEEEREFKMEIVSFPKTTLMRQATEAWEIRKHGRTSKVINRKGEWRQNFPHG